VPLFTANFTLATLASAGISCRRVSVCLSVASRCSTETAKRRIMQTTPRAIAQGLQFSEAENLGKTQTGSAATEAPNACRWGRLHAGAVAANWRLSTRRVVNLARSQVYHTERPPDVFAAHSP